MLWNLNSIPHKKNQLSTLKNKKVGKLVQSARCAVVKCALCSSVSSDLTAQFKRPREKKLLLRVSLKLLKNWRNAGKCALEPVCPYPLFKKDASLSGEPRNGIQKISKIFFWKTVQGVKCHPGVIRASNATWGYWGVKCHQGVSRRQMPPWIYWGVKGHPEVIGLLGRQRPGVSKGPKASLRQKSGASKGPL